MTKNRIVLDLETQKSFQEVGKSSRSEYLEKLKAIQNRLVHHVLYKMTKKNIIGFTLIELLIVMAIISLLAAISIFALSGARETGRDAKRKADLETIRSALELYKADCGYYPSSLPAGGTTFTGGSCNSNVYIEEMPEDTTTDRNYSYDPSPNTNPTSYTLCAALEGDTTSVTGCASCGSSNCSYKTTNP